MTEDDQQPAACRNTIFYKMSRLRMPFTYVIALLAIVTPPGKLCFLGLLPVIAGLAIRVWAAGHVVKRHKLSMGGPYAFTRNPLYVGSFLWGLGVCLLIQNWWLLLGFAVGFFVFYGSAIRSEEYYLFDRYGEQFSRYKKSVPAFIPRPIPAVSVRESEFSLRQVIHNGEHKAFAWSIALVAAILVRMYLT